MDSRLGMRLGPYELVALAGQGGMGQVYRGVDTRLGRPVAVKVLPPEFVADPERRARFEREARLIARLQHPHICTLFDVGVSETPYLVFEFLEGQSLADRLATGAPPLPEALTIASQVADALAFAHAEGVVHRDVKPSNVMLTARGATLLDFGLARAPITSSPHDATVAGPAHTTEGTVLGTPGYMSPEQATGVDSGPPSDVFAFGALLYELLTGRPAFRRATLADTVGALFGPPPAAPSSLATGISPEIDSLVLRCLAADRHQRPASMQDVLESLSRARATAEEALKPPPLLRLAPRESQRPAASAARQIIGRDAEVAQVVALLSNRDVRLLTLVGTGGIGKTRLAAEVARLAADRFPGGVVFVGLASVTNPALLMSTIARTLDITPRPGVDAFDEVVETFRTAARRNSMLVLDNFEQLTDGATPVAELLDACPHLTVLVTSRELLRLSQEREFQVPPLALPERGRALAVDSAIEVPSVALFVQRARSVNPGFEVTSDNVAAIVEICTQLDGLPLALELAAARMRTLTAQALASRLGRRLQVLTTGARDVPARQQTLRNTIDWSFGLLSEAEQRLMRRLGVFAGGCTLDGVESVCDATGDLGIDVLDGVGSLVDKSLLVQRQQADGDTRLSMLETIREYALERLTEHGEFEATQRAHAAYCVVLCEEADAALPTSQQGAWLARLDLEVDNCRQAFDWLVAQRETEWAVRLAVGWFRYWEIRAMFHEAHSRLQSLLRLGPRVTKPWARVQMYAGMVTSALGNYDAAQVLMEQSLAASRQLGDRPTQAVLLNNLGVSEQFRGRYAEAAERLEAAARLWEELRDDSAAARASSNLGSVEMARGHLDDARRRYSDALRIFTAHADRESVAWTLCHLGAVASRTGDPQEAKELLRRAMATFESLGQPLSVASAAADLGCVCMEHGEPEAGFELLASALRTFDRAAHQRGIARVLEDFAVVAARQGQAQRALRLGGAASALRKAVGLIASAAERARLMDALGPLMDAESERHFEEGRRMPRAQAVELALGTPVGGDESS